LTKHHVVVVPDSTFGDQYMNETNITTGGYVGSYMYTDGLETARTTINSAFSGHVLSHRIYLTNAVSNGRPSAGAWCDSTVDLMNEMMVYGCKIFSPVSDGSTVPTNYTVEKSQLPLFTLAPQYIHNRKSYWLRNVVSAANFALVGGRGLAYYYGASNSYGVRPAFCVA